MRERLLEDTSAGRNMIERTGQTAYKNSRHFIYTKRADRQLKVQDLAY